MQSTNSHKKPRILARLFCVSSRAAHVSLSKLCHLQVVFVFVNTITSVARRPIALYRDIDTLLQFIG